MINIYTIAFIEKEVITAWRERIIFTRELNSYFERKVQEFQAKYSKVKGISFASGPELACEENFCMRISKAKDMIGYFDLSSRSFVWKGHYTSTDDVKAFMEQHPSVCLVLGDESEEEADEIDNGFDSYHFPITLDQFQALVEEGRKPQPAPPTCAILSQNDTQQGERQEHADTNRDL